MYGQGDDGGTYVWNGWGFVNRLGSFITEVPCPPDTDIEVFNIVDSIDELTQEVVGKKLEFSEEKYEQKQVRLQQAEQARITEEQRKADLGFLASTDWYVVRQMETGVAMPLEIKTLRAEARERL
jgi:hypothetical protein